MPSALITGGSRGIGKSICEELASKGYNIAFTYRSQEQKAKELESTLKSKGVNAKAYCVDMSDESALKNTLDKITEEFSDIEVLVNNAGISIDGLSMRFKTEDFDKLMDTNIRAAFITTQACVRPLMKAKKGSIIFISSVIGQMGNQGQVAYSTTKAALFGMMKSFAKELGSRNIRVNAVAPGFIKTDMTESLPQAAQEGILSGIPLGYLGEPNDVAKLVSFLASSDSRYITGQIIGINGGLYM